MALAPSSTVSDLISSLVGEVLDLDSGDARHDAVLRHSLRLLSSQGLASRAAPSGDYTIRAARRAAKRAAAMGDERRSVASCEQIFRVLVQRPHVHAEPIVRMLCELSRESNHAGRVVRPPPLAPSRGLSLLEADRPVQPQRTQPSTRPSGAAVATRRPSAPAAATARRSVAEERLVLRDVLYAFQGIDGQHVKYDAASDGYRVAQGAPIPLPMRALVCRLCEMGWLFRHVCAFVARSQDDQALGLVAQSFRHALQEELTDYYRFIAVLESQLDGGGLSGADEGGETLTLRRLAVWTQEPLQRLQLMAELADGADGLRGGALASAVRAFAQHGDPFVSGFVERIMEQVSAPLFRTIRKWVVHGELDDPYGEFFVSADHSVPDVALWHSRYWLDKTMVPSFVGESLARRVLTIGKTINFMRYCCNDERSRFASGRLAHRHPSGQSAARSAEADAEVAASSELVKRGFEYRPGAREGGCGADHLVTAVEAVARSTNKKVLQLLLGEYQLLRHCRALKQYLMLGQGDMIQYLMDLLAPHLSKPATKIFRHDLKGHLETAVRASNALHESEEVLNRLDVRLLEPSRGDCGWDIFSLGYHLGPPLSTVIAPASMDRYLQIFAFLWRLKRVEYVLNKIWSTQMTMGHSLRGLRSMQNTLHRCHLLRAQMLHFITLLHSYLMFEVLETAWKTLGRSLAAARDLDGLIAAHEAYLTTVLQRSLLVDPSAADLRAAAHGTNAAGGAGAAHSSAAQRQLHTIFDLIIRFANMQELLSTRALEVAHALQQQRQRVRDRTAAGKWGVDFRDEAPADLYARSTATPRPSKQSTHLGGGGGSPCTGNLHTTKSAISGFRPSWAASVRGCVRESRRGALLIGVREHRQGGDRSRRRRQQPAPAGGRARRHVRG